MEVSVEQFPKSAFNISSTIMDGKVVEQTSWIDSACSALCSTSTTLGISREIELQAWGRKRI